MSVTSLTADRIPAGVHNVGPAHSSIGFAVLQGTVDVATVDTGEENRDGHLKAPDFFDVDQHPVWFHFRSNSRRSMDPRARAPQRRPPRRQRGQAAGQRVGREERLAR